MNRCSYVLYVLLCLNGSGLHYMLICLEYATSTALNLCYYICANKHEKNALCSQGVTFIMLFI